VRPKNAQVLKRDFLDAMRGERGGKKACAIHIFLAVRLERARRNKTICRGRGEMAEHLRSEGKGCGRESEGVAGEEGDQFKERLDVIGRAGEGGKDLVTFGERGGTVWASRLRECVQLGRLTLERYTATLKGGDVQESHPWPQRGGCYSYAG